MLSSTVTSHALHHESEHWSGGMFHNKLIWEYLDQRILYLCTRLFVVALGTVYDPRLTSGALGCRHVKGLGASKPRLRSSM